MFKACLTEQARPLSVNQDLPGSQEPQTTSVDQTKDEYTPYVTEFLQRLDDSTRLQVQDIPAPASQGDARLGVLFSGGIDCTILAYLANKYVELQFSKFHLF